MEALILLLKITKIMIVQGLFINLLHKFLMHLQDLFSYKILLVFCKWWMPSFYALFFFF